MEDRELVGRLLAKDEEAFRYFYDAYQTKIYKACSYLLGYQDPDAEDLAQEVFLAALKQLPRFEFRSSLYHWLYRIAMYLCYERVRRRRRMVASEEEALETAALSGARDRQDKAEEENEKKRMTEILTRQKELLGEPCRGLLDLRDGQSLSYARIADVLRVPIGTVMSRLARCRESLKALFLKALREGPHGR
ncbi:MAG TPA: RNA polymerase sigma factor [bacterium]|nr:RNA polymerase sigma factor [bacterium]